MQIKTLLTRPAITTEPATSLRDARALMRRRGIRHLPVMDGHRLVGMLAERDIERADVSSIPEIARHDWAVAVAGLVVADVMARDPLALHPETPAQPPNRALEQPAVQCRGPRRVRQRQHERARYPQVGLHPAWPSRRRRDSAHHPVQIAAAPRMRCAHRDRLEPQHAVAAGQQPHDVRVARRMTVPVLREAHDAVAGHAAGASGAAFRWPWAAGAAGASGATLR